MAAQRHRQDRADHADRPDDDAEGADHRRDGAEPVRAGRPRRHGRAHRRQRRSGSEAAEAPGVRGRARSISPVPPKQRTLAVDGRAERARSSRPGETAKLALDVRDAQGQPVAERRGRGDRRRRGDPRADRLPVPEPDRRVLRAARHRHARPLLARVREAREARRRRRSRRTAAPGGSARRATAAARPPRRCRRRAADGAAEAPAPTAAAAAAEDAPKSRATKDRRRRQRTATPNAPSRRPAIAIRSNFNPLAAFSPAVKTDADGKATVDDQGARQPDALPHRRDRGRRRQAVRQGRERADRAAAADGAAEPAAVPQLRRHVRAAGRGAEPDRRADDGAGSRCARRTRRSPTARAARSRCPPNDRVEVQFPAAAEHGGHGAVPDRRRVGQRTAMRPSSRCRCGRRRRPRRSRPTA